jgi:hypothetical protein
VESDHRRHLVEVEHCAVVTCERMHSVCCFD